MKFQEAALICSAIAFILYINTLDCGYCFDDESAIVLNRDLRPETPWINLFKDDFWGASMTDIASHKSYRPLTVATFRLNYMLHELEPLGYHLVNVLLHSAVVYLYVLLCGAVFSQVWPALVAGLLFAVHPIHTEAVAGVVGRAETVCSIFYLFAIFCYRKATSEQSGLKVGWFCTALVSIVCSALSKEQGITAAAVCLAYDALYNIKIDIAALLQFKVKLIDRERKYNSPSGDGALLKRFTGRAIALVLSTILFMMFRLRVMGGSMPTFYFEETNPAALEPAPFRQLNWLYLCWVNVWLLLNPSPLCADWANGTVPLILTVTDLRNFLTLALFAVLALLLSSAIRREKTSILFSLSLLILPYLPASNLFFPVGFVVAERVLYLPSMGFCMLAAQLYNDLTHKINRKWGKVLKFCLVFTLLIQSGKTVRRNRDWVSEESLWKSGVAVNPGNAKVFTNLAKEYESRNDTRMVLQLAEHALRLQPRVMLQWTNVAFVHKSLGHLDEAERYLRGALGLVPEGKKMTFHIGHRMVNVYGELGNVIKTNTSRLREATSLFSKAVSLETTSSMKAHWKMLAGECYLQMNDHQNAMNEFQSALDVEPNSADTNYNLAVMYGQAKDKVTAEKYLRRALDIKKDHLSAVASLAVILSNSNDTDRQKEAFLLLEKAAQIEPTNFKHLWRSGKLHLRRREYAAAKSFFLRALQLDPHSVQVWYSLGKLYTEQGQYGDAVRALEGVLAAAPDSRLTTELLVKAYRETGRRDKAEELEKRLQNMKRR